MIVSNDSSTSSARGSRSRRALVGVALAAASLAFGSGIVHAVPGDADDDTVLDVDELPGDLDGDSLANVNDPDDDGDGIPTIVEKPLGDTDSSGTPDHYDNDDDNDGVPTLNELPTTADADGDGVVNYRDTDDDGDGVATNAELPANLDTDADGTPNRLDFDDDNDGALTSAELPVALDSDGDSIPNRLDPDDDNDGIPSSAEQPIARDTDGDGTPNRLDADDDNDGVPTSNELPTSLNTDGDGSPNFLDTDDDGDGVLTSAEVPAALDSDGDGTPNRLDTDDDGDGVPTSAELPANLDTDGDGTPNRLDTDDDADGVPTKDEAPAALDTDGDGVPNRLDTDDDNDGVLTKDEAPPALDTDGDGVPNRLDVDDDNDGIPTRTELPATRDGDADGIPDYLDSSPNSAKFIPLPPSRLFDTRAAETAPGPKGFVAAGATIDVQITGVGGVPASGVVAVAMNVTVTESNAPSFTTVFPTGQPRPGTSNLNVPTANQTRANLVIVPVGADGKVSFYSLAGSHLLADVAGYFVSQTTAVTDGRMITVEPARLFDTRTDTDPALAGKLAAATTIKVPVRGKAGVPATGASAVIMNVTATETDGAGFVVVWPGTGARPTASSLNFDGRGQTAPNQVIVPIAPDGTVSVYASAGAHVLADVTGYVTDTTATSALTGLFVPLPPARVFDTRASESAPGPKGLLPAGGSISPEIAGVAAISPTAGGVVLNVTGTQAGAQGFITGYPRGISRPNTSTVNLAGAGDTRPNGAILDLGADGDLTFFSLSPAHVLADVFGYLLP
jgi:hypothetical protein